MISRRTLAQILEASRSLHGSGSLSPAALIALTKHLASRKVIHSAETGTGISTVVFSHMSEHHSVFTVNTDESMSAVERNPLLAPDTVTFIEGPTQKTLPRHVFDAPLQAVLIDGPHAYPFPDLEYFYLYPHLEEGGLLVLDDIHIPSIHNLFAFLRRDAMFRLEEVCGRTAFFRRTSERLFEPWGDGWWLQGFNRRPLWRHSWQDKLKSALPARWRPMLRRYADRVRLRVWGKGLP
ncbi:MAG: class I SAM-dependent methyltransferase [Bryobacteraceae bacterium]